MNVSLTRELEELVNEKSRAGNTSPQVKSYVKGCRLVRLRREKIAALRREIQIGVDEIERGEYVEYTSVEELFADVEAAVVKRAAKKRETALMKRSHPLEGRPVRSYRDLGVHCF